MNSLIFTIRTVPDVEAGRELYGLAGLPDKDVIRAMAHLRHQQTGSERMPLHLQRIMALSVMRITSDDIMVETPGDVNSNESELLSLFFSSLDGASPVLVSWGGNTFGLPVIHLRSLVHGVVSPGYWNNSDSTTGHGTGFIDLYQGVQHIDLSALLAGKTGEEVEMSEHLSAMFGVPRVETEIATQEYFLKGDITSIRSKCERDVLSIGLLYLRFEKMRGRLTGNEYNQFVARLNKIGL